MRQEITVVGGGLMGSAAAWQLAKAGQKVLLLEKQDETYSMGSSFGEARISRSLGPQEDIFSYLQQVSVAETEELIRFLNTRDQEAEHSMENIYRTSPVTYLYSAAQQTTIDQLLRGQQDKIALATTAEEAKALFGMNVPETARVIREYKPYSGTLNPRILLAKLRQGIVALGGRIDYQQTVTSLQKNTDHFELVTINTKTGERNTFTSNKVVAAAGPYNARLLREIAPRFQQLVSPQRLSLAFFRLKNGAFDHLTEEEKQRLLSSLPFAEMRPPIFYAMIEAFEEDGNPLIKVGGHLRRKAIEDLDEVWHQPLEQEDIDWSREHLLRYFKMLSLPLPASSLAYTKGYSCVYTLTASEIPYVTKVSNEEKEVDDSLIFLGGMSGVGAKGALAYGLFTANLLLNKEDRSPMYQKTKRALSEERSVGGISIFTA